MKASVRGGRPILVTGGAGFVGSAFVSDLLAEGRPVIVYDDFFTGREPPRAPGLTVVRGDIRDGERLAAVVRDHRPEAVCHLAALHFIPYCDSHPIATMEVNVVGTQVVLETCREAGIERLVFASSAAVYGIAERPHREDEAPDPQDVYGLSKLFGERQVAAFHRATGVPCVVARFFNVYGPGETNPHIIPEIFRQLAEGRETLALGNLTPRRDLVHVKDVASALRCFLDARPSPFAVFNIGSGRAVSVAEALAILEGILGRRIAVAQEPDRLRPVDRPHLQADISRLCGAFAWQPQVTLEEGLRDLAEAILQRPSGHRRDELPGDASAAGEHTR
jgi:UDP-glucose 4-epimerase